MKRFQIMGLFMALICVGCQGGSSSGGGISNKSDLLGAWEVTGAKTPNGQTVTLSMEEKTQYEISETELSIITSDESSVKFGAKTKYHLEGNKIVTEDTSTTKIPDPVIVSMNQGSMVWRFPTAEGSTSEMDLVLTRITAQQLATNAKKTVSSVRAKYAGVGKNKIEGQVVAEVASPSDEKETRTIGCYASQGGDVIVGYTNGKIEGDKYIFSTEYEHLNMTLKLKFDKSKSEEFIDVSDSAAQKITKYVSFKDVTKNVIISSGNATQCKYRLSRKKRTLKVEFDCQAMQSLADKKTDSANLSGEFNCVLFSLN